jgi:hypothetical protein
MFVSVGSRTNDAEHPAARDQPGIQSEQRHPMGYGDSFLAFGQRDGLASLLPAEEDRADVLEFKPDAQALASSPAGCAIA